MDSYTESWSTPRPLGVAMVIGGLLLLVGAVLSDPAGVLLLGLAGVLMLAFAIYALTQRPRLAIATDQPQPRIAMRTLRGTAVYPRDRIARIRIVELRRIARSSGQLEIDVLPDDVPSHVTGGELRDDTRLIVFGRWDLGTDVHTVADALRQAGFIVEGALGPSA